MFDLGVFVKRFVSIPLEELIRYPKGEEKAIMLAVGGLLTVRVLIGTMVLLHEGVEAFLGLPCLKDRGFLEEN